MDTSIADTAFPSTVRLAFLLKSVGVIVVGDKIAAVEHEEDQSYRHVAYLHEQYLKEGRGQFLAVIPDFGYLSVAVDIDAQDSEKDEPGCDIAGEIGDAQNTLAQCSHYIRNDDDGEKVLGYLIEDVIDIVYKYFFIICNFV